MLLKNAAYPLLDTLRIVMYLENTSSGTLLVFKVSLLLHLFLLLNLIT